MGRRKIEIKAIKDDRNRSVYVVVMISHSLALLTDINPLQDVSEA
jgi:hypothetical protein